VDGQSTTALSQGWKEEYPKLQQQLREGSYQPQAARRVWIPKPGTDEKRPLGIPAVRDRVVQAALKHVMEPIFERDFAAQSYGFRPGKRAQDALSRVEALLRQGKQWIVDADLKGYFDTIPQDKLMGLIRKRIQDGRVLGLVEQFLKAGIMDQGQWSARIT
jgi:RNA-directed DNA polymerase